MQCTHESADKQPGEMHLIGGEVAETVALARHFEQTSSLTFLYITAVYK